MTYQNMTIVLESLRAGMDYVLGSEEGKADMRSLAQEYAVRHYPKFIDSQAMADPSLGHVYELGRRGSSRHRLFGMIRENRGVRVELRPAKMLIPLTEQQTTPNPNTGRSVKKRYRFPARPFVYEYGKPVVINRKPGTKFMWTATARIPPQRGPIRYIPGVMYKFRLRTLSKAYFQTEGKMHMNAAARAYAQQARRRVIAAARLA
jgi:hypothetical protein